MKKFLALALAGVLCLSPVLAKETADPCEALTGREGSAPYLTCGELTATAEDYLEAVRDVGNCLLLACEQRDIPFQEYEHTRSLGDMTLASGGCSYAWDNTVDGAAFSGYLAREAEKLAFYRPWSESALAPQPTQAEFRAWAAEMETSGGYLRFFFIPVKDARTAETVRDGLNEDESRLEELWTEHSLTPELPMDFAGSAEDFVPQTAQALRAAGGKWGVMEFPAVQDEETTIYAAVKALPLTVENYRALLLEEAWPAAIDPESIRPAEGAPALDAAQLYEDWFDWAMDQEGKVDITAPARAMLPQGAVIAQAGAASPQARSVGTQEAFPAVKPYPGYADVKEGDWFYANAKLCYEVGLITGSNVGFEPFRVLTVGEAAAIAARMSAALTGTDLPAAGAGEPWYAPYVAHLESRGVKVPDPGKTATRQEFVSILAAILPGEVLSPINTITALPDTQDAAVLDFYRAGILTGKDDYGTFDSAGSLTRSEAAAMVSRVARESLRMPFTPKDYAPFAAAGVTPGTVFFQNGTTAEAYLPKVMARIAALEDRDEGLGVEFNWFHTLEDGTTYLNSVKDGALSDLGVTGKDGTQAYQAFDVQVFYSRYIDLTGKLL